MKRTRINKRKYRRHSKFIILISLFIICVLSVGIGIKFTQRAKASSDNQNKLQKIPLSATDNKKTQVNTTTLPANDSPIDKKSEVPLPTPDDEDVPNKVAYLTFDDGPSTAVTPKILDILKQENVQATFFVIGSMCEENPELLKREKAEGHSVGNHTYSHEYNIVYSSPENFIKDIKKSEDIITKIIGSHDTSLIRFPGGSFGRHSYKDAVSKAGYRYIDWNCLTGDAEVSRASVDRLLLRFNETIGNQDKLIILMHDAPYKTTTPEALPQIIKILKDKGYTFKGL